LKVPNAEDPKVINNAIIKVIAGQYSSHLVYCYLSSFRQQEEGQHPGQQQQQHRQGQLNIKRIIPIANPPMNIAIG
jgi:hypothetical protein